MELSWSDIVKKSLVKASWADQVDEADGVDSEKLSSEELSLSHYAKVDEADEVDSEKLSSGELSLSHYTKADELRVANIDEHAEDEPIEDKSWRDVVRGTAPEQTVPVQTIDLRNEDEPGDPIGIREVHMIIMPATQMNLSHFHTAGMDHTHANITSPSVEDAMVSKYSRNNTGMKFDVLHDTDEYKLRGQLVGKTLGDFVTGVGSNFTKLPDRENIWYEALGEPFTDAAMIRLYVNVVAMRHHGFSLKDLAEAAFGSDCTWRTSPDFMGMIDIEFTGTYLAPWLSRMSSEVGGVHDILSLVVQNGKSVVTAGSDILAVANTSGVRKETIWSNNVKDVYLHFGVEAAACVLRRLTSRIISDFMTRTGAVVPYTKHSVEVRRKGLLTSMGFERPKEDIKYELTSERRFPSGDKCVYTEIMTGQNPRYLFDVS